MLDKWSRQEKICLASAVCFSAEQSWASVGRSLTMTCGANRPSDWFSQQSCALQYEKLLEKYKDNKDSSEISAKCVFKSLTEDRIAELKNEIRKDQEEYAKIHDQLKLFQAGNLTDMQLVEMLKEIEKENHIRRIEEMKMENRMREREERNRDHQNSWRSVYNQKHQSKQQNQLFDLTRIQQEDSDFQENSKISHKLQEGTSPLLSSLLKSTSTTTSTTNTVRSSAPTITTLLTGGIIDPNKPVLTLKTAFSANKANALTRPISGPPITGANDSIIQLNLRSPSQSAPTLSMLLEKNKTGAQTNTPPVMSISLTTQQQILSPFTQVGDTVNRKIETEMNQICDSNNEEVPMDIEEDIIGSAVDVEKGDQSPSKEEEQQLMEVFKSIGNIDEFAGILNPAILEEEAFLKNVESLMEDSEEVDFEGNLRNEVEISKSNLDSKNLKSNKPIEKDINVKENEEHSNNYNSNLENREKSLEAQGNSKPSSSPADDRNIENISSDDSNVNVPLVAFSANDIDASRESLSSNAKERGGDGVYNASVGKNNSSITYRAHNEPVEYHYSENILRTYQSEDQKDDYEGILSEMSATKEPVYHKTLITDSPDVIVIQTDDESNEEKQEHLPNNSKNSALNINREKEENQKFKLERENTRQIPFLPSQPVITTTISLADTDDDSSTMDTVSNSGSTTKIAEKISHHLSKSSNTFKKQGTEIPSTTVKDDVIGLHPSTSSSLTVTKQTLAIRKLRDRDRSESPMIEDDASDHSVSIRSRRRYSMTPVTDSIPNSPASSDDREFKAWKKSIMNFYNSLLSNKNTTIFLHPFSEEQAPHYKSVCLRPIDMQIIKRNIESGTIRTVSEFQRDVLIMCQNAIMVFNKESQIYNAAQNLIHEIQLKNVSAYEHKTEKDREKFLSSSLGYSNSNSAFKIRGSSRKSQRLP